MVSLGEWGKGVAKSCLPKEGRVEEEKKIGRGFKRRKKWSKPLNGVKKGRRFGGVGLNFNCLS